MRWRVDRAGLRREYLDGWCAYPYSVTLDGAQWFSTWREAFDYALAQAQVLEPCS